MRYQGLIFVWIAVAAGGGSAADVVLREQAIVRGPIVHLGDIADIAAANEEERDRLVSTPLMVAPAAGAQAFLHPAQIRDLLAARGIAVADLKFGGSDAVAIGEATAADATSGGDAVNPPTGGKGQPPLSQVTKAIVAYLRVQTGQENWKVEIDPEADLSVLAAAGGGILKVGGGKAPWTGRQRFDVSTNGAPHATPVYAHVERIVNLAFAVHPIDRGDLVRAMDVELRPYSGDVPTQAISSLETATGKEAIQSIRPDGMLLANQLRSPLIVHRGERVAVRARATGVVVRTYATATQDGGLGDLVMVQSLEGKERYAARVCGSQELEVFAGGVAVADLAKVTR